VAKYNEYRASTAKWPQILDKIYHYLNRLHGKSLLGGTTEFAHADQRIEAALSTEFTMD
jgi:uncharacterized protein YukE